MPSKKTKKNIQNFVKMVEDRKGFVSIEELLCDLITLYYECPGHSQDHKYLHGLPPNEQLMMMHRRLQKYVFSL